MDAVFRFACPPAARRALTPLRRMLRALADVLRRWRARRARLLTLQQLLEADDRILRDIGVTRDDVRAAMDGRRCAPARPLRRFLPVAEALRDPELQNPATLDQLWASVARGQNPKG